MKKCLTMVLFASLLWGCYCGPSPAIPDARQSRDARAMDVADPDTGRPDRVLVDHRTVDSSPSDFGLLDTDPWDAGIDSGLDASTDAFVSEDAGTEDAADSDSAGVDGGEDAATGDGPALPPETPGDVVAYTGASIRLTYASAARATSYQAFYALLAGGPYTAAGPAVEAPTLELTVSNLTPGLPHYFVVRASNAAGHSPYSEEVSATPQDGISHLRGTISGTVYRYGAPFAGAVVRLYTEIDHGDLLAETQSGVDGSYTMDVPTGLYRGVIAGYDEAPFDGDAFEVGVDATGIYLPPRDPIASSAFEVGPAAEVTEIDIDIEIAALERTIAGSVYVNAGWPMGKIVVEAFVENGSQRFHQELTSPGPFAVAVPPGVYDLQAFLDVDGNGLHGINEPRERYLHSVDVSAGNDSGKDITIGEQSFITGVLSGANGWTVAAVDERQQVSAHYATPAPDSSAYSLGVPLGQSFTVSAFLDLDGNGQRSFYDADGDSVRSPLDEEWSEPGLDPLLNVAAGSSDINFALGDIFTISGAVSPAMVPWTVVARNVSGDKMFLAEANPNGSFSIEVAADAAYYVYAYHDSDGNRTRTLGSEPMLLYGGAIDVSSGDVTAVDIFRRTVRGSITDDRSSPDDGYSEVIVAQQIVQGVGGPFCSSVEHNNYARAATDGSFHIVTGAVGSGGGTGTLSACDPSCTGVTLTRYLDFGNDYVHSTEGCGVPEPYTYPATTTNPSAESLVLDTSAGDLAGFEF